MNWWQYLLLVNVYLVLFYGFYAFLLRKETFFQLNRIYLVSAAALSFFIPMMQASWIQDLFITQEIKYTVYGSPVMILQLAPVKQAPITIGQILGAVYIAGVVVLFGRLIWQLIVLNRIIKKDEHDTAYSFFNKIRLPDDVKDNNIVSLHEQVHARQWHSADVFIIEAVMIINWFNPVVYFYRRAIKHIHEFIADDYATKQAANKAEYAMLLLSQTFEVPTHNLVNHFFNHSLLKQRIIMLQKDKSQRIKLLKYGLSAPLFMLMLILTSATVNNSKAVKAINNKISDVLLLPAPTVSSITKFSAGSAINEPATISTMSKNQALTIDGSPVALPDTNHKNDQMVFSAVEKEPEFPGGQAKFMQFLGDNIKIPQDMIANNVSGRVIATFIVEADGSLSDIKVLRSPTQSASDEATRVLKLSPKWRPGYQNGKAVRVQYTVPIAFNTGVKVIGYKSKTDTGKIDAVYIVDGKQLSNSDVQAYLKDANNIISVNVKKDPLNKAKGVVEITTFDKPGQSFFVDGKQVSPTDARALLRSNGYHTMGFKTDPSDPAKNIVEISTKAPKGSTWQFDRTDMTYLVDGKEVSAADAKTVAEATNYRMIILEKAPTAQEKGIIEIKTEKPVDAVLTQPGKNDPLYVVDGKEGAAGDFKTIDPKDIESISVLKGPNAKMYGTKGETNGVIIITTKAAAKKAQSTGGK